MLAESCQLDPRREWTGLKNGDQWGECHKLWYAQVYTKEKMTEWAAGELGSTRERERILKK